jgi:hypothetical protein
MWPIQLSLRVNKTYRYSLLEFTYC